jgi:hypothetical protein
MSNLRFCKITSIVCLAFLLGFIGCGVGSPVAVAPITSTNVSIQGHVHGGEQPVTGATIQFYAAGMPVSGGGYGMGAVGLITGTLPVTDSGGYFSITGRYALPANATYLYLTSSGGSSGAANPPNAQIGLMAAINNCTGSRATAPLSSSLFIDMDEVSTVGAVFALQNFMAAPAASNTGAPNVGGPASAYNGLQNAFETSNNLTVLGTGTAMSAANDFATTANNALTVNTLADILVSCINSNPLTSGNCAALFADATPASSFTAADTIQAAWYMAQNPTSNVSTLFYLQPPSPPFIGLGAAPSSFALPIATSASACQAGVNLLSAANFNILGAATITNTGATVVTGGDVGLNPGTSMTGFPPGTITLPALAYVSDSVAAQAQTDAAAAYTYATGLMNGAALPADLSNLTLTPGLYTNAAAETLNSGTLTLDAQGDANAVFIFQIGTTLTTISGTQIVLANGAQARNVYWAIGSSATLGTYSTFEGTLTALQSITMQTGAAITGRAFALNAAVSLDTNTSTAP